VIDLTVRNHAQDAARSPIVVAPEATLREVARSLYLDDVGAAVVSDGKTVLGIISERDVVRQLALDDDPDKTVTSKAMTRHIATARPEDSLLDVVFQMVDASVRHIPVVDADGDVVGMVSIRDVLRPLLLNRFLN
jgi:CBS domain-containing protein